jgi:hypothetical protein
VRVGGERRVSLARHRDVGFKRLRQAEGVQPRAQNKQRCSQKEHEGRGEDYTTKGNPAALKRVV